MRLIKCRKCGATLCTDESFIENMMDMVHELNKKARRTSGKKAQSYIGEAAGITKIMKGIIHQTAQMEERKITCQCEMSEIIHYIRTEHLVSDKKLDELRTVAREKAERKNAENQKEIERLYGKYRGLSTPFNNTMNDSTASTAIRNIRKHT